MPTSKPQFTSKEELRKRARKNIEDGAVTQGYKGDREKVIELLNEALATELVCVLRYKRHYFSAKGIVSESIAEEFHQHAAEEQEHADQIAERITQLGGEPDMDPRKIADRAHSEYTEGKSLVEMIREDLVNERIAIDSYAELIRFVGDDDTTTKRMLEEILAKEEEHASEFADLLATIDPSKPTG
ncbi:MAG: bacterioferritin [Planctomycetota bacterium]